MDTRKELKFLFWTVAIFVAVFFMPITSERFLTAINGTLDLELAVAVAISLFGLQSGAALATVVGVLVEVPVMLTLVRYANHTRKYFNA